MKNISIEHKFVALIDCIYRFIIIRLCVWFIVAISEKVQFNHFRVQEMSEHVRSKISDCYLHVQYGAACPKHDVTKI